MSLQDNKSNIRIGLILIAALVLAFGFLFIKPDNSILGGYGLERATYDVIGTASSPTTTNSVYAGNTKTILSEGMENLHLDIQYTPGTTSGTLFVLVEGSNDNGTTYFPVASYVRPVDGVVDQFNIDPVSVTTTASGIPFALPKVVSGGLSDSEAATVYKAMVDVKVVADHIKISALESTTSTAGTAYIRATLTNNE